MENNNQILIKNLKSEEGMIQALADLFSFPNSDFLNSERLTGIVDSISELSADNFSLINKIEKIITLFKNKNSQELMIEYAKLFVGPYNVIAPPYGSYYLENKKLMGDSTIEVSRFYDTAGLSINESFKDLPDHIIAELEFLLFLTHNEIQFLEKSEFDKCEIISNLKKEFFNKLFINWIKIFSDEIQKDGNSEFYKEVAELLNLTVDLLNNRINNITDLN